MDIIKVRNAGYVRYEELLLRRDQLRKEAQIYQRLYVKEFGDLILAIFELQIRCIKKKKTIGYYQKAINHGGMIDQDEVDAMLQQEMSEYYMQLQDMIDENDAAKQMTKVSTVDLLKIKKIYHRLARQLHPDINPKTSEIPKLQELWNAIVTAYNCNSLTDMEEAEILVQAALEQIGLGYTEIEIPDLGFKIGAVEADIRNIRETDPYQYKYLLEDPRLMNDNKLRLEEQKKDYIDYEQELDAVMDSLLKSGVRIVWKMN